MREQSGRRLILAMWQRAVTAAALAVATASVGSTSAAASEPVPVHRCHLDARIPDDGAAHLRAFKSFRDDGSVNSMHVTLEDNGASAVRRGSAGDQAFVTLRWPGDHRARPKDAPFDWDEGSIQITYLSANGGERHRTLRGEEWRQVIIDRNNAALAYASEGRRELFLPGRNLRAAPPRSQWWKDMDAVVSRQSSSRRCSCSEQIGCPKGRSEHTRSSSMAIARSRSRRAGRSTCAHATTTTSTGSIPRLCRGWPICQTRA
jgi:hypothetical protein